MSYPPPQQPPYQPGPTPAPGQQPANDDQTWRMLLTYGAAVGSFISLGVLSALGPLIAFLARGKESPAIRAEAVAALNFFVPVSGVAVILFVLRMCLGVILLGADLGVLYNVVSLVLWLAQIAVWAGGVVFGILCGVKAGKGERYGFPFQLSLFK
ncbi:DUF4870 domain-containing protein [Actinocatenispora rupis]|uniref:DUF4870 domain-containing protein n=1 Tax=Actinocatenispora rupis TaxID=519421 RepID=A0A8J3J2M7_9ACTN|nr:DUF4870 domain-containing protein [Actinocatenispora rupis]GID10975.1 hypothetical protein Aru02nite_18640 [Actinocatenispora rupis]